MRAMAPGALDSLADLLRGIREGIAAVKAGEFIYWRDLKRKHQTPTRGR